VVQFGVIVPTAADVLAVGVGEARCVRIAESVMCHDVLLGI
jgi:hypothetical protein